MPQKHSQLLFKGSL